MLKVISVGKPYPGHVPSVEGARFEMAEDGSLSLFIHFPRPSQAELNALKAGFNRYSFFEAGGDIAISSWVFKFPAPVGYLEAPFHAGLYADNRAEEFLKNDWNALHTIFLDGKIVLNIRLSGLQHKAVGLFKETIRRQLSEKICRSSYDEAIGRMQRMSPKEIFRRGDVFLHGDSNRGAERFEEPSNKPVVHENTQAAMIAALGLDPVALGGKLIDGELFKPDANPNQRGPCARCGKGGVWIAGAGETLCARHQDDY